MARERKLAASLADREKQLDSRESAIKEEEKKLQVLKSEIVAKIDALKGLEDKLSGMLDAVKAVEDKRLKDLATVFEATTPAQAGTMLERMDKKLAAGIIMNMKSKKAGAVWGHIEPQRAAEIAKEITSDAQTGWGSTESVAAFGPYALSCRGKGRQGSRGKGVERSTLRFAGGR